MPSMLTFSGHGGTVWIVLRHELRWPRCVVGGERRLSLASVRTNGSVCQHSFNNPERPMSVGVNVVKLGSRPGSMC